MFNHHGEILRTALENLECWPVLRFRGSWLGRNNAKEYDVPYAEILLRKALVLLMAFARYEPLTISYTLFSRPKQEQLRLLWPSRIYYNR